MTCILPCVVRSFSYNIKPALSFRFVKSCIGYRYKSYEPDGKTTVSILNTDPNSGLLIDSFSQIGFRLNNGMVVIGPMAVFPKTVLSWNISNEEEINEETLSLFCCLEPKIDLLVLGVGDNNGNRSLNSRILNFMHKYNINVEVLSTEQACSTFNFLNAEKRYVAGGLIPPTSLRITQDDIASAKLRSKQIYEIDD